MKKLILPALLSVLFVSPVLADEIQMFYGSEVLVTASRRLELRRDSFASNRVLYESDIEKTGAKTVADALRSVPDVYIKSNGGLGGVSTVKLKSTGSEQVLILVDGQRINSNLLGMTDLNDIPVDMIDRIEIVDESLSSMYGADAVGGAINIITKKSSAQQDFFNAGYGSFGTLNGNAGTSGKIGRLGYLLSVGGIKSDGFRQNSDYSSRNVLLSAGVDDIFSAKYASTYSERGNPGVPASDSDPYSSSTPNDRQSDLTKDICLSFNPQITDNTKLNLNIFDDSSFEKVHYQDFLGTFIDEEYASRTTGAGLQTCHGQRELYPDDGS